MRGLLTASCWKPTNVYRSNYTRAQSNYVVKKTTIYSQAIGRGEAAREGAEAPYCGCSVVLQRVASAGNASRKWAGHARRISRNVEGKARRASLTQRANSHAKPSLAGYASLWKVAELTSHTLCFLFRNTVSVAHLPRSFTCYATDMHHEFRIAAMDVLLAPAFDCSAFLVKREQSCVRC